MYSNAPADLWIRNANRQLFINSKPIEETKGEKECRLLNIT